MFHKLSTIIVINLLFFGIFCFAINVSADTSTDTVTVTATVPTQQGGGGFPSAPPPSPPPAPPEEVQPEAPLEEVSPEASPQEVSPEALSEEIPLEASPEEVPPEAPPEEVPPESPPPVFSEELLPPPPPSSEGSIIETPGTPGTSGAGEEIPFSKQPTTLVQFSGANDLELVNIVRKIKDTDLIIGLANGKIRTSLADGDLQTIAGDKVFLWLPKNSLINQEINFIELALAGKRYLLSSNNEYYGASFEMPGVGEHNAVIDIRYNDGIKDALSFNVKSLPHGFVGQSGSSNFVNNVEVFLFDENAGGKLWPAGNYGQKNAYITDEKGLYFFVVPNGKYRLVFRKDGYYERRTYSFLVSNNVVNKSTNLVNYLDWHDPDAALLENAANFAKNIGGITKQGIYLVGGQLADTLEKVNEIADDPTVEKVTKNYISPAITGSAAVILSPSFFGIAIPLARYLFLQPLLFLGVKRRREWGQVYNSLNKMPLDLTIIRLLNADNNRVIQSRVTDNYGRYLFVVEEGKYKLEVLKKDFIFPSKILSLALTDGRITDIYHGEILNADQEKVNMTPNIPGDPVEKAITPKRIVWYKRMFIIQNIFALSGVFGSMLALYVVPAIQVWSFFSIHIVLYLMFLRFIKPKATSGWGIVYDLDAKKPLHQVIVRLYNKEFNKLVDMQITNRHGRYGFLVGPNNYYLTFEKPGYAIYKTKDIDLKNEDVDKLLIKKDIGLKKIDENSEISNPVEDLQKNPDFFDEKEDQLFSLPKEDMLVESTEEEGLDNMFEQIDAKEQVEAAASSSKEESELSPPEEAGEEDGKKESSENIYG